MNYAEAIQFLHRLQWFGAKFGLENVTRLAELAGSPHRRLRFIHVAGTNGKGSTCAMLESIYRAGGLRAGLFTSPHLVSFGERIQVNRQPISETDVARLVAKMEPMLKTFPQESHPTFFEVVTVMALQYFAEQKCDLVIWETGLGGRLDATNIVTPLASVITNIQFDHQHWLGSTLEKIAFEKGGIIKHRVPVITGVDDPGAFRVLFEIAQKNESPFYLITPAQTDFSLLWEIDIPLPGAHQRMNAALAVHTIKAVEAQIPVDDRAIKNGLMRVHWPGRFQVVEKEPGQTIVLDGAHNAAGAEALRATLQARFPNIKPVLILGIMKDKDCQPMCEILAPLAKRIFVVPVSSPRSATTGELAALCRQAAPETDVREFLSLREAIAAAANGSLVVIAGSLYLIGEAMEFLALSPIPTADERKLNEWNANPSA